MTECSAYAAYCKGSRNRLISSEPLEPYDASRVKSNEIETNLSMFESLNVSLWEAAGCAFQSSAFYPVLPRSVLISVITPSPFL